MSKSGRGAPPSGPGSQDAELLRLNPRALTASFLSEPLSFWCLCSYFLVEYVRPQGIIPALEGLPLGRATLALTILAFVVEGFRVRRFHLLDGLMLLFSFAWLLSVVFAVHTTAALASAYVYLNWLLVYFLVTNIVTTKRRFLIFLVLFLLWSLKLSSFTTRNWILAGFRVPSWGARGPQGWFHNPGELGIQMVVFFSMGLHFALGLREHVSKRFFWALVALLPATAAITNIVTNSRGSQLALAAIIVVLVAQTRHRVRSLVTAAVALTVLWAVVPDSQRERFEEMGDDRTSEARTYYWKHGIQITNEHPLFGVGFKNWLPYYHSRHDLILQVPPELPAGELPHNIFIEASAEMGYTGLLALLALMGGVFVLNRRTRRLARHVPEWGGFLHATAVGLDGALIGLMISGFFVTVLYYPYLWVTVAFSGALFHITRAAVPRSPRRGLEGRTLASPRASPSGSPGLVAPPAHLRTPVTGSEVSLKADRGTLPCPDR